MRGIALAPFTEADIDRLIGWVDSPELLARWTASTFAFPLTRAQLEAHLRESAGRGSRLFKAVQTADGEVVGHVELGAIDRENRSLRVGRVLVGPPWQGRGHGAEMMRAALELAFGELGMHRVELWVFDFNHAALALYERVGFRREGVRREAYRAPGGGWWSTVVMGILASEWAALGPAPGGGVC